VKSAIKNHAASVRAKLENASRKSGRGFSEVLLFYSMERFLYRLTLLPEGASFVLKGGIMFRIWDEEAPRPTRDLDLLSSDTNDSKELSRIMALACEVPFAEDGIVFDPKSMRTSKIKEDADYEGVRIKLEGKLGTAKTPIQIDIGYGDVVVPRPIVIDFPTVIDLPAPRLKTYTKESVIAEKLHAMIFLGNMNSRMKDFYDIWFLASKFDFDGKALSEAVNKTFMRRKTDVELDPIALSSKFANDPQKQIQWDVFYEKLKVDSNDENRPIFTDIIAKLLIFIRPLLVSLAERRPLNLRWRHQSFSWVE
jgi:hypothetical protein